MDAPSAYAACRTASTARVAASVIVSAGMIGQPALGQDPACPPPRWSPARRTTSGMVSRALRGGDDPRGDHVAAHDAAEDVDQDALHLRIGEEQAKRRRHLFLGGAAADVEEVGRLPAVELDDVHRRHRQARAVDHAADVAVQGDVVEADARAPACPALLLVGVAECGQVRVAEERVVVQVDLRVERDHLPLLRHDQRVDLRQAGVDSLVGGGRARSRSGRRRPGPPSAARGQRQLPRLVRLQADGRVDPDLEDSLRGLGGHGFNLHPAFGAGHRPRSALGAVEEHAQVSYSCAMSQPAST